MFSAAEGLKALGVDIQLQYLGNLRSPLNLLSARKLLRDFAPEFDLLHAQFGSACALASAAVTRTPKIISIRGNDWNLHNSSIGYLALHTRLARLLTRYTLRSYDLVVAVSRRMEEDLRGNIPGLPTTSLPSPIDLDLFKPVDKEHARAALGFPGNTEHWVLFNALRLDDPVKRFSLAQQAIALANRRIGNIRLRTPSNIPHKDMPLFVAACDLLLCTSETEGWPNAVKEALACDVPFVATDVSDLRDIAASDPLCRVAAAEPTALADCICDVLTSPAPRRLRQHVLPMGMKQTSETLLKLYQAVLRSRTG